MNQKKFLQLGGAVLVLVGVLGLVGFIGSPGAELSTVGPGGPEHLIEFFFGAILFAQVFVIPVLVLGVLRLIAAYMFPAMAQKWLTIVFSLVVAFYALLLIGYHFL